MPSLTGLQGFVYRGQHSSAYGVILNKITRSIMAPLTPKLINVPSMQGAHFFGREMGPREFKLDITIVGTSQSDMLNKARAVARWLLENDDLDSDGEEENELIFDVEPDKSYFGFLSGDTNLDHLVTMGTTQLTFICPDPYAYGPEVESPKLTTSPASLVIGGKEKTFPVYDVTFTADSTYFALATKKQHVFVGSNAADQLIVEKNEKVINDQMSAVTPWEGHSYVDGGVSTGTMYSTGQSFRASSYGSGSEWHGPAMRKMYPTPLQDFQLDTVVGLYATDQKQIGRVEVYLLDANGNEFGKVALVDTSGYEVSTFEARIGTRATGKYLAKYTGSVSKKTKKVKATKKVKGKKVTYYKYIPEQYGSYRDFYGLLQIKRVGKKITARIERRDPNTGKTSLIKNFSFTDSGNDFQRQIAGVAVHVGQYKTNPAMSTAYCAYVSLTNLKNVTKNTNQVIFEAGDELKIDTEEGAVYLNGSPFMDYLSLSSEFFSLNGGRSHPITFEPDNKTDVIVSHRPRYL